MPRIFAWKDFVNDPENTKVPSSVHRISINQAAYFGDKYKITKIFEDDGTLVSGATTAAWDENSGVLWIHGASIWKSKDVHGLKRGLGYLNKGLTACKL